MAVKQLAPKNILITQDRLKCIIERFERIKRHLSFSFYFLAILQLVTGSLSVVAHAHESDGLFGDETTIKIEGIVLASITEIIAGIIIIVPIHSSMIQCEHSIEILNEYKIDKSSVPIKVLQKAIKTNTLCYKNPFSYSDCTDIKESVEKKVETV